jgi:hypothetical protein
MTTILSNVEEEYWTEEYLIDQIFLMLAVCKIYKKHNRDCGITVYKYYSQAFRLFKPIIICDPDNPPEFIISISDLTPRIIAELETLDDSYYVLKLAVGRIFENIDSNRYHLTIASKLKVRLSNCNESYISYISNSIMLCNKWSSEISGIYRLQTILRNAKGIIAYR